MPFLEPLDVLWRFSPALALTLVGALGAIIGSFLNVVILRWPPRLMWQWTQDAHAHLDLPPPTAPAPDDLVFTRSRCPKCGHQLSWWENIPLLGVVLLGRRCRGCKTPISWQYPLVEALGALVAISALAVFGPTPYALAVMGAGWTLLALSGIDAHTMLLPDLLVYPLLWTGLLLAAVGCPGFPTAAQSVIAAAAGYLSLWGVCKLFKLIRGKEGMGHGDFKLLAALCAWTGLNGLLPIVAGATVVGAVVGVIGLVRGADRNTPQPFGPYLAAAGFVQILMPSWLFRLLGV